MGSELRVGLFGIGLISFGQVRVGQVRVGSGGNSHSSGRWLLRSSRVRGRGSLRNRKAAESAGMGIASGGGKTSRGAKFRAAGPLAPRPVDTGENVSVGRKTPGHCPVGRGWPVCGPGKTGAGTLPKSADLSGDWRAGRGCCWPGEPTLGRPFRDLCNPRANGYDLGLKRPSAEVAETVLLCAG